jgi:hypothetical protein
MYSNESAKKVKSSGASKKRSKKGTWGSRERSSFSFLIVIAFFAIFGIIILTEVSAGIFGLTFQDCLAIDPAGNEGESQTSWNSRWVLDRTEWEKSHSSDFCSSNLVEIHFPVQPMALHV